MTLAYELYRDIKTFMGQQKRHHHISKTRWMISHLENSEKFILPTVGGMEYDQDFPAPWIDTNDFCTNLRLPYSRVTIEYKCDSLTVDSVIVMAQEVRLGAQDQYKFAFRVVFRAIKDKAHWQTLEMRGEYDSYLSDDPCKGFTFYTEDESPFTDEDFETFYTLAVKPIVTLASKRDGVELSTPFHHSSAARSAMSKKRKIFAHRQLLFSPTPVLRDGDEPVGTHASPAMHKRRGHFRQLKSGKIVWVRSAIVGKAEHGVVTKDYVLEGANQ